jgi:hypothetical protein
MAGRPYAEVDVMIRNVSRVGLGLALAIALAAPAAAQQPAAPKPGASNATGAAIADNKGDISFQYGYMNLTAKKSGVYHAYNTGWAFSGAKRVARGLSLMASVSGYIGDNIVTGDPRVDQKPAKVYSYVGGVRFSTKSNALASGKRMMFKPFAEALMGGANDNATFMNHFTAMMFNGGVDIQMATKFSIRVQGGMPLFTYFGPVLLGPQFQIGFVVPFVKH